MTTVQPSPYIAIEGVIGVGKTTLVRLLTARFEGQTLLEAFDENPFLSNFYGDRDRYAFQTQMFFLLSRYRQQQNVPHQLQSSALLADYFFAKDKLFAHLNIKGKDELEMYDRLYEALSEKVHAPDLIVYLRAETDTLMARIAKRDRPYERQMERDYIAALRQGYEDLFAQDNAHELLIIDSDELDFVRNPKDLEAIEQRIQTALEGTRQPRLPDMQRPVTHTRPTPQRSIHANVAHPHENDTALNNFLRLSAAVGEIGGFLVQTRQTGSTPPADTIHAALKNATNALASLSGHMGTELDD